MLEAARGCKMDSTLSEISALLAKVKSPMLDDWDPLRLGLLLARLEYEDLDIEAQTEINLKVGQSTIKMLPTSIEISSPTITIKSVAKTEVLSDATVIVNGALVKIN